MRATPLKIITTARRSVHTLMGSNEAFSTRTRAFMVVAILREPKGRCQKSVSKRTPSMGSAGILACGTPASLAAFFIKREQECSRPADRDVGAPLPKLISSFHQRAQIPGLHD